MAVVSVTAALRPGDVPFIERDERASYYRQRLEGLFTVELLGEIKVSHSVAWAGGIYSTSYDRRFRP